MKDFDIRPVLQNIFLISAELNCYGCLVNEMIISVTQCIILKIFGFLVFLLTVNCLGLNCNFRKNFNPFYNATALGSVRNQTQQSKMVFDDQQLNFFTTLIHWKSHHSYPLNQI